MRVLGVGAGMNGEGFACPRRLPVPVIFCTSPIGSLGCVRCDARGSHGHPLANPVSQTLLNPHPIHETPETPVYLVPAKIWGSLKFDPVSSQEKDCNRYKVGSVWFV